MPFRFDCSALAGLSVFVSDIVAEMDFHKAICRIPVFEFSVLDLVCFLECKRNSPRFCWTTDAWFCIRDTRGVIFPLPSRVVHLVDDRAFMKLFDNLSFHLTHAPLAFRRLQEVDWSKSSCVGWFPYLFEEGAIVLFNAFTALGRERGTGGEPLPSETLSEIVVT